MRPSIRSELGGRGAIPSLHKAHGGLLKLILVDQPRESTESLVVDCLTLTGRSWNCRELSLHEIVRLV